MTETYIDPKRKVWTYPSTLKSMIHQISTLAVLRRGHCEDEVVGTGAFMTNWELHLHFPEPIIRGPEGFRMGFIKFPHQALNCKLKTDTLPSTHFFFSFFKFLLLLYIYFKPIHYQISSHSTNLTRPYSTLWGFLGTKWDSSSFIAGHKISTETSCSWHEFFKLPLFFLKTIIRLLHLTTNITLELTITQPFFGFVEVSRTQSFLPCPHLKKWTKTKGMPILELQAFPQYPLSSKLASVTNHTGGIHFALRGPSTQMHLESRAERERERTWGGKEGSNQHKAPLAVAMERGLQLESVVVLVDQALATGRRLCVSVEACQEIVSGG